MIERRFRSAAIPQAILDHQLERSLAAVTIGMVRQRTAHERNRRDNALQEIEQQFQTPFSGEAGTALSDDDQRFSFTFDSPFVYAPGNRDSDLDVPQFSFGAQVRGAVQLTGHVTEWIRDPGRGVVTGASVRLVAHAPGVTTPVPFSGVAHFTFQGYAAVDENESEG